jgi:hypothetical protein
MGKKLVIILFLVLILGFVMADGPPGFTAPQQFYGEISYNGALIYNGCSIELKSSSETSNCVIKDGKYGYSPICSISSERLSDTIQFFIEGKKVGEKSISDRGSTKLNFVLDFSPTCAVAPSNPPTDTNPNPGSGGGGGGGGSSGTNKIVTLTGNDDKNITNLSTNESLNFDDLKSSETQSRDIKAGDEKENLLSFLSKGNVAMWLIVFIIVLALFVGVKAKSRLKENKNIQAEISKIAKSKSK